MAVRTAVILVANFGLLCFSQSYNMILDAICSTILCSRFCFWWNVKIVSTCENVAQSKTARQGLQIGLDLLDMDDMDMFGWYGYIHIWMIWIWYAEFANWIKSREGQELQDHPSEEAGGWFITGWKEIKWMLVVIFTSKCTGWIQRWHDLRKFQNQFQSFRSRGGNNQKCLNTNSKGYIRSRNPEPICLSLAQSQPRKFLRSARLPGGAFIHPDMRVGASHMPFQVWRKWIQTSLKSFVFDLVWPACTMWTTAQIIWGWGKDYWSGTLGLIGVRSFIYRTNQFG